MLAISVPVLMPCDFWLSRTVNVGVYATRATGINDFKELTTTVVRSIVKTLHKCIEIQGVKRRRSTFSSFGLLFIVCVIRISFIDCVWAMAIKIGLRRYLNTRNIFALSILLWSDHTNIIFYLVQPIAIRSCIGKIGIWARGIYSPIHLAVTRH